MTETRFSVIVPCYRQAHLVSGAVASVLAQGVPVVEVIVVDDGSPDDVAGAVARFAADPRVRYVHQTNAGLSGARNAGVALARGDLLLFLDADDYLLPGMLAAYLAAADARPDADVFHGGHLKVSPVGETLDQSHPEACPDDLFHALLVGGNRRPVHAVVVRAGAVGRVGGFDTSLRSLEDWDLWLRLAAAGCRFVLVPVVGAAYRIFPSSMSRDGAVMYRAGCAVIRKNTRVHRDCAVCRTSALTTPLALRYHHLVWPAVAEVTEPWAAGRYATAMRSLVCIFARDPITARGTVRVLLSQAKQATLTRLRILRSWCAPRWLPPFPSSSRRTTGGGVSAALSDRSWLRRSLGHLNFKSHRKCTWIIGVSSFFNEKRTDTNYLRPSNRAVVPSQVITGLIPISPLHRLPGLLVRNWPPCLYCGPTDSIPSNGRIRCRS